MSGDATRREAIGGGIEVISFGCRLNTFEAEVMKREAGAAGLGAEGQPAIIINTCAVTAEAVRALTLGGPAAGHVTASIVWSGAIIAVFGTIAVRLYRRAV